MLHTIKQVQQLSKEMLTLAENQQWEQLEKVQKQKAALCNKLEALAVPENSDETEEIRNTALLIQQTDQQTEVLIKRHQATLVKEKIQSNKGMRMMQAYKNTP